jgi:RNA polymerase sigma factor (sigma-70 family)
MMGSTSEILNRYARERSEAAFAEIVGEFGGLVYASAQRVVRDPHLAEDVTQAVFILLARKSGKIKAPERVPGWLIKTTYFIGRDALRQKWRREKHEKKAAAMTPTETLHSPHPAEAEEIYQVLDRALINLRRRDRDLVIMRFMRENSLPELAQMLGISEHAVRKRLERALGRLREELARRGLHPKEPVLSTALIGAKYPMIGSELARMVSRAAVGGIGSATPGAQALVKSAAQKLLRAKLMVAVVTAIVLGGLMWSMLKAESSSPLNGTRTMRVVADANSGIIAIVPSAEPAPAIAGYPIASGWPIALPGSITSTPSVIKLNGKPAIVVTCMARLGDPPYVNSHPDKEAWVFAFHPDGTIVSGFPVGVLDAATNRRLANMDLYTAAWSSSPSAIPDPHGPNERMALTAPLGRGMRIIDGQGNMKQYPGGNQWNPCAIADIGHDGMMDILMGNVLMNADGGPVKGWPASRKLRGKYDGFGVCIGDGAGDGKLEAYILHYRVLGMGGYDQTGLPLPHWPTASTDSVGWFAPCMGDVDGDGLKEVVYATDQSITVRKWDGGRMPHTTDEGVLIDGVDAAAATPTLADLDGDGKADIVVYDQTRHAVMAWHGDGSPVGAMADGTLAVLDVPNAAATHALLDAPWAGVSAADLGNDGVMDLFCGIYWIKFDRKSKGVTVTKMLPTPVEMNLNQPTIAHLFGDGKAEVILGLRDGRVVVYETGMNYPKGYADWVTCNRNFQHTGVWSSGKK